MFSVLTPTFNRVHLLSNLYESLSCQNTNNFEWVVVDDGSNDDTKTFIEKVSVDAGFSVKLLSQANLGQHVAINRGLVACSGSYVVMVDSDDWLAPRALARLTDAISLAEQDREWLDACGVIFDAVDENGNLSGSSLTKIPKKYCTRPERKYKYRVTGEKKGAYKTEILRKYPYPELSLKPGSRASLMQHDFPALCLPESLYVHSALAGDSSFTRQKGGIPDDVILLRKASLLKRDWKYFFWHPKYFIKTSAQYARAAPSSFSGAVAALREIMPSPFMPLVVLFLIRRAFSSTPSRP